MMTLDCGQYTLTSIETTNPTFTAAHLYHLDLLLQHSDRSLQN